MASTTRSSSATQQRRLSRAQGDAHSGPPEPGLGSAAAEAGASAAPQLKDPPDRGRPYRHVPRLQCPAPSAAFLKPSRSLDSYTDPRTGALSTGGNSPGHPSAAALTAVGYATAQLGLPYSWGGDGPAAGEAGFDCSGLTTAAYVAAGITIPRTAQTQYDAGPRLPPETPLLPGDLVFFGDSTGSITHVGIIVRDGQMIDAPGAGKSVRREPYRWATFRAARPAPA